MMKSNKDIVNAVIAAMASRPNDFTIGEHTLDDKVSGLKFWVANTRFDGAIYEPFKHRFGIVQSFRFHRAVKQLKIARALQYSEDE